MFAHPDALQLACGMYLVYPTAFELAQINERVTNPPPAGVRAPCIALLGMLWCFAVLAVLVMREGVVLQDTSTRVRPGPCCVSTHGV